MPVAERRRLAQMVAQRRVPLIEDVLCNDLAQSDQHRSTVRAFEATGHVMVCGSFSKTVAPGLRLGWVDAGRWSSDVARLKQGIRGAQAAVLEVALADLLTRTGVEAGRRRLRTALAAGLDEARVVIARDFPAGTRVTNPAGGLFLWVELPREVDAIALFHACLLEHIVIAPGTMFSSTDHFRHCIRLGLGGEWDEAHRQARSRVGELAGRLGPRHLPSPPSRTR